jgi:lipoprotein Spr
MKKVLFHIILIFSILLCNLGFTSAQEQAKQMALPEPEAAQSAALEDYLKGYYSQVFGINISTIFDLNLYASIEKWLGTPYRYAGKTINGIDCSSFVNKIYESAYCFFIGGNSANMYQKVKHIKKEELTEGDLVFFRINRSKNISHVGVYLGDNKFAHASRSKGVIISDLTHPYYKKHFVKGGRVEFHTN